MKKIFYLLGLSLLVLLSCERDDESIRKTPKIAISLGSELPVTTYPGETLDIVFNLEYEKGLLDACGFIDGVKVEESAVTYEAGVTNAQLSFQYKVQDRYAGNTIDFSVCANGADGAVGFYDVPVYVFASKPSIVITIPSTAPETFEVGSSALAFKVSVVSENVDLKSVTTYKGETRLPELSYEVTGSDLKKTTIPFSYTPGFADVGAPVTFKFEVMDVNGNIVEAYYSVTFTKASSSEINEYYSITMGLNKCTAAGQFFDAVKNKVYKANGVGDHCADIDWAIFWSGNATTQGVAFGSPNVQNVSQIYPEATIITTLGGTEADMPINWKVRNNTTFREVDIDAEAFVQISTVAELQNLYDNGTKPANEHVCFKKTAGSVIVFQIHRYKVDAESGAVVVDGDTPVVETEKYGIIRVTARNASNNTGSIVFDYKIEK